MKNIWHFDVTTYLFLLIAFLCGYFKPILLILLIVMLHELGHVLVIKFKKIKIIRVTIYPFGGITKVDKPLNSPIKDDFYIAYAGVVMQLLLMPVLMFCYNQHLMTTNTYQMLCLYNTTIIIFNILPIIPLDGSVALEALLNHFFSYYASLKITKMVSLVSLLIFMVVNFVYYHNYFICGILLGHLVMAFQREKYYLRRFYLERYLNRYPYTAIKNHYDQNIHHLKKETRHYFYQEQRFKGEGEVLEKYFLSSIF